MNLDATAGAYGLLQVVYAEVSDRLASAVLALRQRKNSMSLSGRIPPFKQLVEALRTELEQFKEDGPVADDLHAVRKACDQVSALSIWRNDRIHARVRQVNDGLALYHAETGERLSISYEECERTIQEIIKVSVTLQGHMPHLVRKLDLDKAIEAVFKEHALRSGNEMNVTEYAWLTSTDGKFKSSRPANPSLSELTRGTSIENLLQDLLISDWRRSDAKDVPVHGETEIQIERLVEYYPPIGLSTAVSLDDEREGSFEEKVRRVQRRYEVNGWDFHQVINTMNMGPRLIFTKPEGAPDRQPFVEPNVQE